MNKVGQDKLRVRVYEEVNNQICNVAEDIISYEKGEFE